jgi:hypothetical protein
MSVLANLTIGCEQKKSMFTVTCIIAIYLEGSPYLHLP